MKTKFNKSLIMKRAWQSFRSQEVRTMEMWSFCLKQSWAIAKDASALDFETIYKNYYERIYHFILSGVTNSDDAMDLTQETFLKVAEKLNTFNSTKSKLSTWLYTIAKNTKYDHYRNIKNMGIINTSEDETASNHEYFIDNDLSINERKIIIDNVEQAINNLKPEYKELATMVFIEDMKYKDIVHILNIPIGTVKGQINRIRAILRPVLEDVI